MLKYAYSLVAVFIFFSCHQEIINLDEKSEQIISNNFSFVDIEFSINDISYTKDIIKECVPIIVNNKTSIEQTYVLEPKKHILETSTFWSRDTRAFSLVNDIQIFKTPIAMSDKGVLTYDNSAKWIYSAVEQKLEPNVDSLKIISIKPNNSLKLNLIFSLREIATGYSLYLRGDEFGEIIKIDGQWSGLFFLDYSFDYVIEPTQKN